MAERDDTTTRFSVDISELKAQFQQAERSIKLVNSEFAAATAGMDDWSKSTDGLSAKIKQLDGVLGAERNKLSSLEEQYRAIVQSEGASSEGAEKLAIKINYQRAAVAQAESNIEKYNKSLNDLSNDSNEAGNSVENLGDTAEKSEKGFTIFRGAIATFVGNALSSLASAAKDGISNLIGLADSTKEYRNQMAKLDTAAKDNGYSAEYASQKYKDLYGVLADETAANTTVSNFMAMNASQDTLDSLMQSSIGIWAKYGDSIPLDGLAESINETAKVSQVTGGLADALNWAGINEDDFNSQLGNCSDEQERQRLIADTLNGTYGDLSKGYQDANASVIDANKANADYTDNLAELGAKIEPITTTVKEQFNKLLEKALELAGGLNMDSVTNKIKQGFTWILDTAIPKFKEGIDWFIKNAFPLLKDILSNFTDAVFPLIKAALGWIADNIIPKIQSAIQWIIDHKDIAGAIAVAIGTIIAVLKIMEITQAAVTAAQWLMNAAMSANSIGAIITLVVALVAAFIYLWNNSEDFRNFWINLWDKIKAIAKTTVEAVKDFFVSMWDNIKSVWNGATSFFVNVWDSIKNVFGSVVGFFKNTFSSAWQAVKDVFSAGGRMFEGIKEGIADTFSSIVNHLIDGINVIVATPFKAINGMLNKIRSISIAGVEPFSGLWGEDPINIPQIPHLAKGGILKRGQVGLLEGNGAEAVIPLERNKAWIRATAKEMNMQARYAGVGGGSSESKSTVYNFNQTNNSPKSLSRLEIYRQTKNLTRSLKYV